jgi:hypothetical protein
MKERMSAEESTSMEFELRNPKFLMKVGELADAFSWSGASSLSSRSNAPVL